MVIASGKAARKLERYRANEAIPNEAACTKAARKSN